MKGFIRGAEIIGTAVAGIIVGFVTLQHMHGGGLMSDISIPAAVPLSAAAILFFGACWRALD